MFPGNKLPITAAFPVEVRRHPGGVHISLAHGESEALVELTSSLSSGGQAAARILWYDGSAWQPADTDEITIHDAVGSFEGDSGDRALVKFDRQSGLWLVWQLEC